ncbi:conserved hypothetical protein [Segniliparus rotundus DSM 44985]|uniref:DUF3710 domain-containing protein n=1 Tax=Segniliparus rotundus (strain ATCC BAA-972 / CDC 1076 / CIP 108378 / DSM 44985 / JCM 13578) TaxID=640132 RepID=D6ZER7_SEGRD|nr:DUF3710 domain-containing protein [Segniliparus rotundus]ADG97441.1 conserved hypothetical protein [Segniliparus rotundus DSM 44985]
MSARHVDENPAPRCGAGTRDLGSIVLCVPEGGKPRLVFGPGEELLTAAVLCPFGEVEVRAYAAPKGSRADLGGQWRPMLTDLAESLRAQGLRLFFQDGPWGRELIAVGNGVFRTLIGRDGDRWTLVVSALGPNQTAARLVGFARAVFEGSQVRRGPQPHPAGALLPLRVADPCAFGEFERVDIMPESEPEPFRPRFPDPSAPGANGSAMQRLSALRRSARSCPSA